jgi:hypothetical protein
MDNPLWIAGYRAGVDAARQAAYSSRVNVWWGPNAHPNDGVAVGEAGVRHAVDRLHNTIQSDEYFTPPSTESSPSPSKREG